MLLFFKKNSLCFSNVILQESKNVFGAKLSLANKYDESLIKTNKMSAPNSKHKVNIILL